MNLLLCFIAAPVVFNLPKLWGIEQWRKSFQTALNCSKCTQSQLVMELMCVCFNRFGRIRGSQANGNYFTRYFYKDKEENSILVCLVLSYSGCVSQDGRKQWKHQRWKTVCFTVPIPQLITNDAWGGVKCVKSTIFYFIYFCRHSSRSSIAVCDSMPTLGSVIADGERQNILVWMLMSGSHRLCCKHNLFSRWSFCWSWLDRKEKEGARNKAAVSPGLYCGAVPIERVVTSVAKDQFWPGFSVHTLVVTQWLLGLLLL